MRRVELCGLLAAFIVVSAALPASSATWHVRADGSGDAPTIKAAVAAAAANDSIVVFPGTYNEHDIYVTKRLYIVSVGGAGSTIVDAQTSGRCFLFSASTPQIVLKGFTMRHGTGAFDPVYTGFGGAIFARHLANVWITDCVFSNNMANAGGALAARDSSTVSLKRCSFTDNNAYTDLFPGAGGAIFLTGANPPNYMFTVVIDSCLFVNNTSSSDGGALSMSFCDAWVLNCTFHQNSAAAGRGTISLSTAGITLDHTIVSSSNDYGIIAWYSLLASTFSCNDFYGNAGGNYGGLITNQTGLNYNISADPMYCGAPGDLSISTTSPCAPANSGCGQTIGRFGPGCGPNLTLTGIGFSSMSQPAGTNISAWFTVKNTGTKSTGGGFWFDFFFDRVTPPPPGTRGNFFSLFGPLAGGDSSGVWNMSPIASDTCCVEWQSTFWIDTENNIPETNEADNMFGPYTIAWQPAIQPGWPVSTGSSFHSSPVIAPIDDDPSTLEIAIGCDNGKLYAWRQDGTNVPGFPVTLPDSVVSSPAVGDVIGDYRSEIIVGCNNSRLYAYNSYGTLVWSYKTDSPVRTTPSLADLDGDGKLETICTSGSTIYVLTGDALVFKGWPFTVEGATFASPAVGDVDGDGVPEIAAVARTGESVSKVYLLEANGELHEGAWPVQLDAVVTAGPALGDITTSHGLETVVGSTSGRVYVITTEGVVWATVPQVTGSIASSPIIEDVDKDGKLDIVVTSKIYALGGMPPIMRWNGYVTAINRWGTIMSGWPQTAGYWPSDVGPVPSAVALGTLTDLMTGSPYDRLYCWRGTGARTPSFPLNLGADILTSAAAGQIDIDNWVELVVATSAGNVYCRELRSHSYPESAVWWPMYGHDRARTHCYGFEVPLSGTDNPPAVPTVTAIGSIYPNPFNPMTKITFDISAKGPVEIAIYDVSGRMVAPLVDRELEAGRHEVLWNGKTAAGKTAASGVYFCTLRAGGVSETKKLVLLR